MGQDQNPNLDQQHKWLEFNIDNTKKIDAQVENLWLASYPSPKNYDEKNNKKYIFYNI